MAKKALRDTILVTGASGSVGRAIVADLLACGYSVRATDLHDRPLDTQHPDLEFIATDIRDHSAFPKLLNGVTRVIHAAAASSVAIPWASLRSINVDATTALFDAASQQGVSAFVFLSSASVYQTQRRRIKETDPLEPLDPFARSKFTAERGLLRSKQSGAATKLVVIRPALTLGPHSTALMASLATAPPLFRARLGFAPRLFGGPRTALVHSVDVARAAAYLMEKGRDMAFYNIACDDWNSLSTLFNTAAQAYGLLLLPVGPFVFPPSSLVERTHSLLDRPEVSALFRIVTQPSWSGIKRKERLEGDLEPHFGPETLGYGLRDLTLDTQRLKETGFQLRFPDSKSTVWDVMNWYKQQRWIPA